MARTKNPARLNTDPHPYPGRNRQKYSEMAQRAENMTPMGYLATKSALYRVPEADHPGPSQPKDTLIALGYPGTPPSPHPVPESSSAPFQNFAHVPYYPAPVFKWKTPLLPNPNFDHSNADREPPAGKIPPIPVPAVNPEPSQKMTRSVNTPDTTMGSVNASDVHMETDQQALLDLLNKARQELKVERKRRVLAETALRDMERECICTDMAPETVQIIKASASRAIPR